MRIVLSDFMSLDGVVQAPGGPDEDTDGDFRNGGWSRPFFDPDTMGPAIGEAMGRGLVDEYRLMIEPVVVGGGKRLFPDDGQARALDLVSMTQSPTGVLICTYRPTATAG